MNTKLIKAAVLATALTIAAAPVIADAASPHRVRVCKATKHAKNTGTVVGAVGGGLLGNALTGGKTGGTLIGAGAGAVAGHEIAKSNSKKKHCYYVTRYY